MEFIIILILLGNLVLTFLLWQKISQQTETLKQVLENQADHLSDQLDYRLEQESQKKQTAQKELELALGDRLSEVRTDLHRNLTDLRLEISVNIMQFAF